jgi:AraC-like DNA-binding protein
LDTGRRIARRVRRAKSLLHAGLPIASAAIAAGFYDQAQLTRHFKRVVGVPPGRYLAG